jgi:hypothetical protein
MHVPAICFRILRNHCSYNCMRYSFPRAERVSGIESRYACEVFGWGNHVFGSPSPATRCGDLSFNALSHFEIVLDQPATWTSYCLDIQEQQMPALPCALPRSVIHPRISYRSGGFFVGVYTDQKGVVRAGIMTRKLCL